MSETNYISVPTWSPSKGWHYTDFQTRDGFRDFIKGLFNEAEPDYKFDEVSLKFNEEARKFEQKGYYTVAPRGSKDYRQYWRTMKERCKRGVIFHNDKGQTWYLTRYYYHWLNFLKIYNKELQKQTFPEVLDAQYHVFLYEELAKLYYSHVIAAKKRQFAWTYMHTARHYNQYIFDVGYIGKLGASDKKYIDDTGAWKFINEYRDFNNEHTGWYRPNFPEKPLNWKQQQEITTSDGKKLYKGTKAKLTGHTFDKSPTSGVGGAVVEFTYEESGIAPTLAKTYGYMKASLEYGMITTGLFIAGGSVGELQDAQDMYKFLMNPKANGFYPVTHNLMDKNGTEGTTGLFIPEHWAMPPYIDKYGNSLIKEALAAIDEKFKQAEKEMDPTDYQLYISQHPRNIEEAFAIRTVSVYPVKHTARQIKRIEEGEYNVKYVDIDYNEEGKLVEKKTDRKPITEFPISKATEDKRGAICIYESPVRDSSGEVPWGTYYASVDPVEKGKVTSSDSLFSIHVYKNPIEVTRVDAEGNATTFIEGDKIVAWWCGRYDDINQTNEEAWKIVQYYNAWTLCENQKTSFINYLISKKGSKYLVRREDVLFDRDLDNRQNIHDPYGWSKSQAIWKVMMEYGVSYLSEVLDEGQILANGNRFNVIYGVARIPDIMLLKEMQQYQEKGNYDRIISYTALIAFAKKQQAERGIKKMTKREDKPKEEKKVYINPRANPLSRMSRTGLRLKGNPFKSIR